MLPDREDYSNLGKNDVGKKDALQELVAFIVQRFASILYLPICLGIQFLR